MSESHLTEHAILRMSQRGIGPDDIELIEHIGTEVEGGYLVRRTDFQALERQLKRLRDHARRLVGKRLLLDGTVIVTVYHAARGKQRLLLRGAEDGSLRQ